MLKDINAHKSPAKTPIESETPNLDMKDKIPWEMLEAWNSWSRYLFSVLSCRVKSVKKSKKLFFSVKYLLIEHNWNCIIQYTFSKNDWI